MSVLSFNPLPRTQGIGYSHQPGRIAGFFRALGSEWQARLAARRVETLSDEMLHDIGITRSEIDQAVRYGRRGR